MDLPRDSRAVIFILAGGLGLRAFSHNGKSLVPLWHQRRIIFYYKNNRRLVIWQSFPSRFQIFTNRAFLGATEPAGAGGRSRRLLISPPFPLLPVSESRGTYPPVKCQQRSIPNVIRFVK